MNRKKCQALEEQYILKKIAYLKEEHVTGLCFYFY